jgi:hypothetical protein
MILAAILAVILLGVVVVFQIGLALGAPWGAAAWGGQHPGVLPTRLRIASAVVALVVYPLVIALVLAAAGIIDDAWLPIDPTLAMWVLAGLLGLGAVANFLSRSEAERRWGPVALTTAMCCALIALGI